MAVDVTPRVFVHNSSPGVLSGPPQPPVIIPPARVEGRLDRVLRQVPIIGIGMINVTLAHWGSAVLLKGASTVYAGMAPENGVPTWYALYERFLHNVGFNVMAALPLFSGFECICLRTPGGRAAFRRLFLVDPIQNGVRRVWDKLKSARVVRRIDTFLTTMLSGQIGDGQYLKVDINRWDSVKKDVGACLSTVGLYLKTFLLRGVIGVSILVTNRMPKEVKWASKVKRFLQSRPINRLTDYFARKHALKAAVTPADIARFRRGDTTIVDAVLERVIDGTHKPTRSMIESMDGVAYFVGEGFPGTRGRWVASGADLMANVSTDVMSADILAGRSANAADFFTGDVSRFTDAIIPSAIVSVAGAVTNAGLAENTQKQDDPAKWKWTYAQNYTRRMLLAVSRSWVFRAFCVGKNTPWLLKYGAQVAIGLLSLFKAGQWATRLRRESGLDVTQSTVLLEDAMRAAQRHKVERYLRKRSRV